MPHSGKLFSTNKMVVFHTKHPEKSNLFLISWGVHKTPIVFSRQRRFECPSSSLLRKIYEKSNQCCLCSTEKSVTRAGRMQQSNAQGRLLPSFDRSLVPQWLIVQGRVRCTMNVSSLHGSGGFIEKRFIFIWQAENWWGFFSVVTKELLFCHKVSCLIFLCKRYLTF